jgi:hypothetical protein
VGGTIIELMSGPFRFKKKERKRLRRFAKKAALAADKFETEGIKPKAVPALRDLAESVMARAKSRKKQKPENSN